MAKNLKPAKLDDEKWTLKALCAYIVHQHVTVTATLLYVVVKHCTIIRSGDRF